MARKRKPRTPAARSIPSSSTTLAAGAIRNAAAGMLPLANTAKVRRQLSQHVSDFTVLKGLAAHRKGGTP